MIKNNQAIINFRTKKTIKDKANKVFSRVGLDMSSALNLFLHNVVIKKAIPLTIVTENSYTREEEEMLASVADAKNIQTHKNIAEMFANLEK